jgi:hypothetical protein
MESAPEENFIPCSHVQWRTLHDGAVLVNMRAGTVFELNHLGAEIWSLLGSGATVSRTCDALAVRYRVAPPTLEQDVRSLFESLAGAGLIRKASQRIDDG